MLALPLSPYIQALEIAVVRNESLLSTVTAETSRGTVVLWSPYMLAYAVATATAALVVGLLVFRSGASRFAEVA